MRVSVAILLAAVLVSAGCMQLSRSSPPESVFYRLEYKARAVDCEHSLEKGLLVRDFTAAEPYGQQRMVLLGRNRTIRFSGSRQWVASPGNMLSESLRQDLMRGGLFAEVLSSSEPGESALELSGRILTFAAKRTSSGYRAVLRTRIRLNQAGISGKTLLGKTYSLQSASISDIDQSRFAEVMSGLAGELSARLRADLCRKIEN
ncbi:MAG: ABC-type transport auxiliary lipoprotein family protein [Desulfohalobiaceae bacterium]|nr:ABC-type transport auxiliary lipoprotein family protein [Desulfohalobiaceae bacterium]